MTQVVVDSSAIVALLLDAGEAGQWATAALDGADLAAPHLMRFEASNVIRRHELAQIITSEQAAQAHADLLDLDVELWPYDLLARRVWELRPNLSSYDASYVVVAELLGAPLITLDGGIGRAPGLRCAVHTPSRPAG